MGPLVASALEDLDDRVPVDAEARRCLLAMALGSASLALLWVVPSVWILGAGLAAYGLGLSGLRTGPAAAQARVAWSVWTPLVVLLGGVGLWGSTIGLPLPGPDLVLHRATEAQFALARETVGIVGPIGLAAVSALAVWRFTGPVGHGVLALSLVATGLVVSAVPLEIIDPAWLAIQPPLKLVPVALAGIMSVAVWEALRPLTRFGRAMHGEPG